MTHPPPARRRGRTITPLSIEARPSNHPLGRADFIDLLTRLIRAGSVTPAHIDKAADASVSSHQPAALELEEAS